MGGAQILRSVLLPGLAVGLAACATGRSGAVGGDSAPYSVERMLELVRPAPVIESRRRSFVPGEGAGAGDRVRVVSDVQAADAEALRFTRWVEIEQDGMWNMMSGGEWEYDPVNGLRMVRMLWPDSEPEEVESPHRELPPKAAPGLSWTDSERVFGFAYTFTCATRVNESCEGGLVSVCHRERADQPHATDETWLYFCPGLGSYGYRIRNLDAEGRVVQEIWTDELRAGEVELPPIPSPVIPD